MFLLDVNVLVALMDPWHQHHRVAQGFMPRCFSAGWGTCPLTENGVLRILGHPNYPGGPGSPPAARDLLALYIEAPAHQFWPDDLSFLNVKHFPDLPASKALTDLYLLALAVKHGARLATFDRRIDPSLVRGGPEACFFIHPS